METTGDSSRIVMAAGKDKHIVLTPILPCLGAGEGDKGLHIVGVLFQDGSTDQTT